MFGGVISLSCCKLILYGVAKLAYQGKSMVLAFSIKKQGNTARQVIDHKVRYYGNVSMSIYDMSGKVL